jgi:hypothetical protein
VSGARRIGAASAIGGRSPWHSAVTGRQRYRALSGGSPAGAAAAAGTLASTPPRPVSLRRPVAVPARAGGRPPRAGHPVAAQRSHSRALAALASCGWRYAPPLSVIFHGKTSAPTEGNGQEARVRCDHIPNRSASVRSCLSND